MLLLSRKSASGELSYPVTLPHTITSWSIQALGTSNTSGFGMAPPLSIRTFQDFFVSVNLPYSVQRGEQFAIMVTVFNYKKYLADVSDFQKNFGEAKVLIL